MRVKVTEVTRLANSKNGNPRYALEISTGGKLLTKVDSTVGYVAQALEDHLADGHDAVTVSVITDSEGLVTSILGYGS